jgi:hypothetical protein
MKILRKPRGMGKTYDLIRESARTGTPILTAFEPRHIVELANQLEMKIPEPLSISRYKILKNDSDWFIKKWNKRLLIDDVESVLNYLLNASVDAVTVTLKSNEYHPYDTLTIPNLCDKGGKLFDIFVKKEEEIIDEITDVNIIVPNKVVEVTFADGTKQKAVCQEEDTFSLEAAISICISKQILGGSSSYNNAIKRGLKVYDDKLKKIKQNAEEQQRIVKKKAKKAEYKKRRAAKKDAAEKEKAIAIQTEAYVRAMEEMERRKKRSPLTEENE